MEVSSNCLQEILDKSYEAIYVTDLAHNILYMNKGARALGNISEDMDVLGQKCYECLLHRDSPCSFCKIRELKADVFTTRTYHMQQLNRTFELRGELINWNNIPAHIEFIRDITEQLQAEQKLGELSRQQKNLFEHIGVGMCMYYFEDNTLHPLLCNDAYRQLFYLPDTYGEDPSSNPYTHCFHPDDRDLTIAAIKEHLLAQKPYNRILRVVDPESETIHSILLNMDCVPQYHHRDYWYVSAYDVTDWVNAEARLGNILDNISGGIALYRITETTFDTLMFTDGIPKMQGYTREEYEELIARNALDIVYPEDQAPFMHIALTAINQQKPFSATYRVYHKEKGYIWVELAASPIGKDSEGYMQYNAVFTNASQQFNLYRQIFDSSANGLLVTDYDTQEIYFSNKAGQALISTCYASCDRRDKCSCMLRPGSVTGSLCRHSAMVPATDSEQRKVEIDHRQYQVDTHLIQWMGRPAVVQHFTDITESMSLQSKLQINEDRFQLVVEKSEIKLIDYNVSTGEAYTNMDFENYAFDHEIKIPDFIQNNEILDIVHPEDLPILQQYFENTGRLVGFSAVKLRLHMKDGSYRWTEVNGLFAKNTKNEILRNLLFFIDVDDSMREYEELKIRFEYETARQLSFENGVVERMTLDLTDNSVVSASNAETPSLEKVVGISIEELLALRLAGASGESQPDQLQNFMSRENLLQAFYDGKSPTFESYGQSPKDGEKYYYQISARFAKEPNTGHILAFVNTQNIDASKTPIILMQRLLETNYDTAVVVNAKTGRIKFGINASDSNFITAHPLTYDELLQENICVDVVPEERERAAYVLSRPAILKQLSTSSRYSDRCTVMKGDALAYKMWTATFFDSEKEYILITLADVTEVYKNELKAAQELRTALEAAEVASQSKSQFLARMSHEIRTPISTVSGIHDLIRLNYKAGDVVTDTLFNYVSTADTANRYLLTLINDILDISKIEKDELTLTESVTNIRHVIHALHTMIEPLVQKKNLHLIFKRRSHASDWFKMDGLRVQQILMNLLNNAVKFTPEDGTITFTGEVLSITDNIATVQFVVRDSGIGISEEFRKDLFEPFKQEYASSSEGYGGTGLGLAISRKLARMMGGDITCESKKGEGSSFFVTLKFELATPQDIKLVKETTNLSALTGLRILVCEDNQINQTIVAELLTAKGCIVTTADNGMQGLDYFQDSTSEDFDLVLMDIQMPLLDGLKTTEAIRNSGCPNARTIPIFAMSANAYEEDKQASIAAGMNEHLAKPVNTEQLYDMIARYCT